MSFAQTLRHKVVIQQPGQGSDAEGQPLADWTDVAAVWADIRHLGGVESIKAGAVTSAVKVSIRIRYRNGVNSGMRVLHGAQAYNIVAVLPDLVRQVHVDLLCEVTQ